MEVVEKHSTKDMRLFNKIYSCMSMTIHFVRLVIGTPMNNKERHSHKKDLLKYLKFSMHAKN